MGGTLLETFGVGADELAAANLRDPQTPASPAVATTAATEGPPSNPLRALMDPRGSAIFWIALAAVLGLAMVSGQLKVSAAVQARGGRRR